MSGISAPPTAGAPGPWAVWRHIIAGLSASLIGIGLARFAYTPLIPPLIQAHWFPADDIVYLGAANLAGYLLGAMLGRPIAARLGNVDTLRGMKILVTLSLLACAFPLSIVWFFTWRLLSGVAGGVIMVLVAATVLPHMPSHRRGIASGAVFLGIGLGIAASGTIVPLLLQYGLQATWIGLAALSALLTAASWTGWLRAPPPRRNEEAAPPTQAAQAGDVSVALVYIEYGLMAVGLVAPMVFLVDFIARGLGAGPHIGSLFWIVYGVGAILGPPIYGFIADRFGARIAVRTLLFVQTCAVAGLATSGNYLVIGLVTLLIGSFPSGIVPMVLAWDREIFPGLAVKQNQLWSRATISFAAFQALAGYGYSAVFAGSGGDHRVLFALAAAAIALALALDLIVPPISRLRRRAAP